MTLYRLESGVPAWPLTVKTSGLISVFQFNQKMATPGAGVSASQGVPTYCVL